MSEPMISDDPADDLTDVADVAETPARPVLRIVPATAAQPWPVVRLDWVNVLAFTPVWIFQLGLLALVLFWKAHPL